MRRPMRSAFALIVSAGGFAGSVARPRAVDDVHARETADRAGARGRRRESRHASPSHETWLARRKRCG
jgi:hypothetical protein